MCIEKEESFNFLKISGWKYNCVLLCQLLIIQCIVVGLEYSYRKKSLLKDEYHQLSTFSAWASFHSFWKQFSTHSLTQQKFFSHFQQRELPVSLLFYPLGLYWITKSISCSFTHTLLFLPTLPCYTVIILWFPLLYTSSYGGYYITEVIMIVQKSPPPSCQMAIVSPPAFNNSPIEVTNPWHHSPLSQLIINQQC